MTASPHPGRVLSLAGQCGKSVGWASAILTWSGFQVDRAESAEGALRMLQTASYDLMMVGYNSGPEDIQLTIDLVQDPCTRLPTLFLLEEDEEFIAPPQTHFVPTDFLKSGFSQDDLLESIKELRQFLL